MGFAFKPRVRERNFLLSVVMTTVKMLFIVALLLGVTGTGLLVGVAKAWVETTPTLDLSAFDTQAQTTFLYDKYGYLVTTYKGSENRVDVPLSEVPENLKNAVIAVEDQRFYEHNGVDVRRIVGSLVDNLLDGTMQGGSTITQQLIKLTILSDEQTYKRKLQEAYLALQLEQVVSKDAILEEYLNVIYLGGSNYGVQVASQDYFGKNVSELTLRECAMLARIIKSPYRRNPRRNYYVLNTPEVIEEAANGALQKMLDQELITQAEYDAAMAEQVYILPTSSSSSTELYENAYYVEYAIYDVVTKMLRAENLEDNATNRKKMEKELRVGGYKIYTSLDPDLQDQVQSVISSWANYPKMRQSSDAIYKASLGNGEYLEIVQPQAACTVIDWTTGEIMAIVGGRSTPTARLQTHRAYQIDMPVGSALKPLAVYGPAFDMGYSPGTPVVNAPIKILGWDTEEGYPANFSLNSYNGCESLRNAINKSHNAAAAQTLMYYVGIDNSVSYLLKLGISESRIKKTGAGLALGASGVSTVQMAAGFGAIANEGTYLEPYAFTRVEYSNGEIYLNMRDEQIKREAFKPSTAWLLVDVLKGCVAATGTGYSANFGGFTVAGKTGTNSDSRGVSFTGMTGYYVASVWIGSENYKPLTSDATGGDCAAPLWAAVMKAVHRYKGITEDRAINNRTPESLGLIQVTACGVSGMLPTEACYSDVNGYLPVTDYYLEGTQPTKSCNMHRYITLCAKSKKAPNTGCAVVRQYGCIYLPEGHPLRNDTAETVRTYFRGATTAKDSAAVGYCDMCGGTPIRDGNNADDDRDAVLSYAQTALTEASKLMGSKRITEDEKLKLTAARTALQDAVDDDTTALAQIRTLTSRLKKLNESVKARLG